MMTNALVQGASGGIGLAFTRHLLGRSDIEQVAATYCRAESATQLHALAHAEGERLHVLPCDARDETSVKQLANALGDRFDRLHWLINSSGILHDKDGLQPERRIDAIDPGQLEKIFAVNAFGPLLVTKHLFPLLSHSERTVVAHLSARVGSISDNKLGGWYGYRASKAALNQFVRCMAIELKRKNRQSVCVSIHPGTVDTSLSEPFRRGAKVVFTAEDSVQRMMAVLDGLTPAQSGEFFAYDGSTIEW